MEDATKEALRELWEEWGGRECWVRWSDHPDLPARSRVIVEQVGVGLSTRYTFPTSGPRLDVRPVGGGEVFDVEAWQPTPVKVTTQEIERAAEALGE